MSLSMNDPFGTHNLTHTKVVEDGFDRKKIVPDEADPLVVGRIEFGERPELKKFDENSNGQRAFKQFLEVKEEVLARKAGLIEQPVQATPIMKYFEYGHLPVHLQVVSARIRDLAVYMNQSLPNGPEKTTGLRKLLEAKDCFVRAYIDTLPPKPTGIPAVEDNKFQNRN